MFVRDEYVSSICGHWDRCVSWTRSMGSESSQVMCVCISVCLGCQNVSALSVIQAFQLRSSLINHLPRHPAASPPRHHNASIPQTQKTRLVWHNWQWWWKIWEQKPSAELREWRMFIEREATQDWHSSVKRMVQSCCLLMNI